jgi:hypothetical protein
VTQNNSVTGGTGDTSAQPDADVTNVLLHSTIDKQDLEAAYQIHLKPAQRCAPVCHSGGAARREMMRARDASGASGGSQSFPLPA